MVDTKTQRRESAHIDAIPVPREVATVAADCMARVAPSVNGADSAILRESAAAVRVLLAAPAPDPVREAAPALLAACETLLAIHDDDTDSWTLYDGRMQDAIHDLREALDEARPEVAAP